MDKYMKYITVSYQGGKPIAILFHYVIEHSIIGSLFRLEDIISAGFCEINSNGTIVVFGKSDSLKKESKKEDAFFIRETIRPNKDFDDDYDKKSENIFRENDRRMLFL